MARQQEHLGMNKTGVQMSPLATRHMLDDDKVVSRGTPGDDAAVTHAREAYIAASGGIGSIPLPATVTGMAGIGLKLLKGGQPQILLDKMAERLAFERTGTRLYDALLTKLDVLHDDRDAITHELVAGIRADEARHVLLMKEAIESMGGDPTAQTPSADVAGVESLGLVQVMFDPRTSLAQSLHAILTAELCDNAGWELLVALACEHGHAALAGRLEDALEQERRHLAMVQGWYRHAVGLGSGAARI